MSQKQDAVGIDRPIPFTEKLMFSSTNGIGTFYLLMSSMFLMFFYTDVMKLSVAYVSTLFVVVRVLDALAAPLFGAYIDRSHSTRWGRYKPWFILTILATILLGLLTFSPVGTGSSIGIFYATCTYVAFSLCLSLGGGPGMGLAAAISKRQDDRMQIAMMGFVWVMVFSSLVAIAGWPLINLLGRGDQGQGFMRYALACTCINLLLIGLIAGIVKERFLLSEQQSVRSWREMIPFVVGNKYALITLIYILVINLTSGIKTAVTIYYLRYYFKDTAMLSMINALSLLATLIGVLLSSWLTRRIGLRHNLLLMLVINFMTSVLTFFLPATRYGLVGLIFLSLVANIFLGLAQPAQGIMMPMAIDYGEWRFKANTGALLGAAASFTQTLATALSGGIVGGTLMLSGYIPDVPQTSTALLGIKALMSVIPAAVLILGVTMLWWDLTDDRHQQLVQEMRSRRQTLVGRDTELQSLPSEELITP